MPVWVGTMRAIKFLVLCLPWLFVGKGITEFQSQLAFSNNSVEAVATVVATKPSSDPVTAALNQVLKPEFLNPPSFRYVHENGLTFVGGPVVKPYLWRDIAGSTMTIRYDRLHPDRAQPVSFLRFWWVPSLYVGGGLVAFLALALAFYARSGTLSRRKKGTLNLRRY